MDIYPAIDLMDAQAVRLTQGKRDSAKIYGSVLYFADYFKSCGATWLHIVDLDAAFSGSPCNTKVIEEVVLKTGLKVQVGGGIRSEETIERYFDCGVSRVVLGSIALENVDFAKRMALKHKIAIGIDSRDGFVSIHGWVNTSRVPVMDFCRQFADSEVDCIICTDISRDGLLQGINRHLANDVALCCGKYTIASGGFSALDVEALGFLGSDLVHDVFDNERCALENKFHGVIVGKAIYENQIDLKSLFNS